MKLKVCWLRVLKWKVTYWQRRPKTIMIVLNCQGKCIGDFLLPFLQRCTLLMSQKGQYINLANRYWMEKQIDANTKNNIFILFKASLETLTLNFKNHDRKVFNKTHCFWKFRPKEMTIGILIVKIKWKKWYALKTYVIGTKRIDKNNMSLGSTIQVVGR